MKNTILGLWTGAEDTAVANHRIEQCRQAWNLGVDAAPILESRQLSIWADPGGGLTYGWRGDLFLLWSGTDFDTIVSVPPEVRNDKLGQLAFLYNEHGNNFARFVNGAFSLTIYERKSQHIRLIQSRTPNTLGIFWSKGEWGLCFSNRVRTLMSFAPELAEKSSPEGFYQLLFRTHIIAPKTIYEGISQVPFGHLLRVETQELVEYDPWRIPVQRITDPAAALEEFENLLNGSLERFMSIHPDHVFLLSGGYDSSVNVALGSQLKSEKMITIGIGAEKYNTDAPYARMVAKHVGTDHREYLFDGSEVEKLPYYICTLETPYFEPGMLLSCLATELSRANGRAVIGGEGTDQLFGSCAPAAYARHRRANTGRRFLRRLLRAMAHNPLTRTNEFTSRLENRLVGQDNINTWCGAMGFRDSDIRALANPQYWREHNYNSEAVDDHDLDVMFRFDCEVLNRDYLYYGILPIFGRLAERLDLVTFSPYLDRRVTDFILSLDDKLRTPLLDPDMGTFGSKYLQCQLALKLLPAEIFERTKQGGSISPFIHLEDSRRMEAIKCKLARSEYIQQVFRPKQVQALFNEPQVNSSRIFLMLSIDLWFNLVVKTPLAPETEAPSLSEYLGM